MDDSSVKLSIIIPCYNSSEYIAECLYSVFPYLNETIEVIVVNDGSTDDSISIISKVIEEYPNNNINVLSQENGGLSAARNNGLAIARGKFISFLDSDDFYHHDFWKEILPILDDESIDIIEFNADQFNYSTSDIVEHIDCAVFSGKNEISSIEQLKPAFQRCKWYPWARVYKTALFKENHIQFPIGKLYEDMSTIPLLYLNAKCIYGINKSLIWYRYHSKSITQTFRNKDLSDLVYVACVLSSLAINKPETLKILFPTVQRVFNFIKYTLVKNKNGYFAIEEQRKLRTALMTFESEFRFSRKIQIIFLPLYLSTIVRLRKK